MKVTCAAPYRLKLWASAGWLGLCVLCWAGGAGAQVALLPEEERQAVQDCAVLLRPAHVHRSLQLVKVQLQSQGLRLQLQGCPFVRTGASQMQQVLDVRVWVVDSDAAAHFVRGPLADTEPVDMGDVQLGQPVSTQGVAIATQDVSPDVLFNRHWLASVMQAQGFQNVRWHWWAFLPASKR